VDDDTREVREYALDVSIADSLGFSHSDWLS